MHAILAISLLATAVDCINADLQLATGDALAIAKLNSGHANVRYISLYAIPKAERARYAAGISVLCNQLSHAGVVVHPRQINDMQILRLELDAFDPQGVGWAKGWELIVAHDTRWHSSAIKPQGVYRGGTVEVLCADNKYYPAQVLEVAADGTFQFQLGGKTYNSKKTTIRHFTNTSYGDWTDQKSALLLEQITGSKGAILEAREFVYYATRFAQVYYAFRNSPKTLKEWRELGGETGETTSFGEFGVRGANLDFSNVTHMPRGLERGKLGLWLSYDVAKGDIAHEKDIDSFPDRTHKSDAYEGLRLLANGGMDCFISNGAGQRVDAVPANIALDTSYVTRELIPPLSCWSCHTRKAQGTEQNGFIAFTDRQSKRNSYTKDPVLAASLAAYFSDQDKLSRDMARDREDFAECIKLSTDTGIGDAIVASDAFLILNEMALSVSESRVDARRAIMELCIEAEEGVEPKDVVAKWWNGTVDPALIDLINGETIHYERFRKSMPEALFRIQAQRQFLNR